MGLNISKGNMYEFVTHTWNTIKGQCSHDCSYCYMKRWKNLKPVRFDEKELNTDLGQGNFIFVGSSNDLFNQSIPSKWITKTLDYCGNFYNKYLFQTKNPGRIKYFILPLGSIVCTTIETNRHYDQMGNSPKTIDRAMSMTDFYYKKFVTIEPIMKFDLYDMVDLIKTCDPIQVNIGADSGNNDLPEPTGEEISDLIIELKKFTKVKLKSNIKRLLKINDV